jgi:type I restriction enzyme, S subunit
VRWPTAALGEIATIERNSVFPSDIRSGSRYVGLEHIESGGGSLSYGEVTNGELASNKFQFGPRHILFGKLRPYLAKIVCPDFEGICSTDILPIAPGERVDQRYLLHFLRFPRIVDWASSRATGVNLPRLSPNQLASLEIPLPRAPSSGGSQRPWTTRMRYAASANARSNCSIVFASRSF